MGRWFLLQDIVQPFIQQTLDFDIKTGIKTVYSFLKERNALALLSENEIGLATKEIFDGSAGKWETQREIKKNKK